MEYSNDDTNELKKNLAHHLKYTPDAFGTVRAVGIDKYPGEMAILRELVQNADDAIDRKNKIFPTYIKFILKNDEIIVEHNGKPFSKPPNHLLEKSELNENELEELNSCDFKKISNIGLGKTDEELTGKFGTGFTSSLTTVGTDTSIKRQVIPITIPFLMRLFLSKFFPPLNINNAELIYLFIPARR